MTTVQVRFRFICQCGAVELVRFHNIPVSLLNVADEGAGVSDEYRQLLTTLTENPS